MGCALAGIAAFKILATGFLGTLITDVPGVQDNDFVNGGLTFVSSSSQNLGAESGAAFAGDGLISNISAENGLVFDDADTDQRLSIAGFNSSIATIRIFTENEIIPNRLINSLTVHYKDASGTSLSVGDYDGIAGDFPMFQILPVVTIPEAITGRANQRYHTFSVSAPAGTQAILLEFGSAAGAGDRIMEIQVWPAGSGLPFSETFDSTTFAGGLSANWDTTQSYLTLPTAERHFGSFASGTFDRENITLDDHETMGFAAGDIDGDGDIDLVAANKDQINRVYLNNGTASFLNAFDVGSEVHNSQAAAVGDLNCDGLPDLVIGNFDDSVNLIYFNDGDGVVLANPYDAAPVNLTSDAQDTRDVVIADINGDGYQDVVVANEEQPNRLYLNNGTDTPFEGVSGSDITPDVAATKAIVIADLNHDGFPDIVAGNRNSPNTLYLNNGTDDPFAGVMAMEISPDSHFTEGIALADFNGDGLVDVYAANDFEFNRVYLNNGTATPFVGVTGQNAGDNVMGSTAVATGDVDQDGLHDVAVANAVQFSFYHRNNGGLAPFINPLSLPIPDRAFQSSDIVLADLDGDGDLDAVLANRDDVNQRFVNTSSQGGIFFGVEKTDITTETFDTRRFAVGDLNRDGRLDLVVAHSDAQENQVLLNNGTAAPFDAVTPANITTDAAESYDVALGDIDSDGDLDLVVANLTGINRRYLGNGNGGFGGGANITADNQSSSSLALGDLNGDGHLDLVVGNDGTVDRIYLNDTAGDPWPAAGTGTQVSAETLSSQAVALGDLDNNGTLDLVVGTTSNNRRYLGAGDGTFGGGSNVTSDSHDTRDLKLADIDCDGNLDLIVCNASATRNKLYLGNGNGTFNAALDIGADADSTFSIAVVDVNKDGLLDVIAETKLYLNNGTGDPFGGVNSTPISAPFATDAVAAADFDNNGSIDVVMGSVGSEDAIALNPFTSVPFSPVDAVDVESAVTGNTDMIVADLNGDSRLDVARLVNNTIRGNLNNGESFPNDSLDDDVQLVSIPGANGVAMTAVDADNDGNVDIAVARSSQIPRIAFGSGNAMDPFPPANLQNIGDRALNATDIVFGDLDGDTLPDAIVSQQNTTNLVIFNDGDATPLTGSGFGQTEIIGTNRETTLCIVAEDFDNDGDLDVIFGNQDQVNRYHRNNGMAGMGNGFAVSSFTEDTRDLVAGDVDGDGLLDLIVINRGFFNFLFINNGTGTPFSGVPAVITADFDNSLKGHLVDIDLDGDLDLVIGNDAGERAKLYINDGSSSPFKGTETGFELPDDMAVIDTAIGSGDVDKNATVDLFIAGNGGSRHYFATKPSRFDTTANIATSVDVDQTVTPNDIVRLTPTGTFPPNSSVELFANNAGSSQFFRVKAGDAFTFPTSDDSLHWKARLHSLSGALAPELDSLLIERVPANLDPVIMDQVFAIDENTMNGTTFGPVIATDPDVLDTLTYEITTMGMPFSVDPDDGTLTVTNQSALDFETAPGMQFVFTVEVTDDGIAPGTKSASATITVTLNDVSETPVVADQLFRVPENTPNTTLIGTIAFTDPDAGDTHTFTVLSGDPASILDVNMMNGEIRVNDVNQLDHENVPQLVLNLQVSDSGMAPGPPMNSVMATITVDVLNVDDAPIIGNQAFNLTEAAPDNFSVGQVAATEPDVEQALKYRISAGDPTGIFTINEDTGEIRVADASQLDKETSPSHMLTIEAYGLGRIGPPFTVVSPLNVGASLFTDVNVKLHDLDGDGDLDAVIAGNMNRGGGNEINRVFLNNGTPDPFNAAMELPLTMDAADTRDVAIGDVTGDFLPDVLVANAGGPNRLYVNNGAGIDMDPFSAVTGSDISADSHDSLAIALIHANGDMLLDVLIGNALSSGGDVRLYINDGMGDPFDTLPAQVVATGAFDISALATGLFNPDANPDIIAGAAVNNRLLLNDGSATPFTIGNTFAIGNDMVLSTGIAAADFDGDMELDFAVANRGAHNKLFLNDGNPLPFSVGNGDDVSAVASSTEAVVAGDIDNDGDIDLVFAEGFAAATSLIHENNGTFAPFNGVVGRGLNAATPVDSRSIDLGDADGDGDLDILLGNSGTPSQLFLNDFTSRLTNTATVTINIDDANEAPTVADQTFNIDENSPMGTPLAPGMGFIAAMDEDLPANTLTYGIIADNSGGAFTLDPNTGQLTVADPSKLDYESDTEFELTVEVTDDGSGELYSLAAAFDISTEANDTRAILLHDMNRDSLLDLVVANYLQENLIFINNGTAAPFNGVAPKNVSADRLTTRSIAVGDFTGDGAPDLIFGNDSGPNRLVINNGTADPFSGATGSDITGDPGVSFAIGAADLNGDTIVDAYAGNSASRNRLYVNNTSNNPFFGVSGMFAEQLGFDTRAIALHDMDGDGHIDAIDGAHLARLQLHLNNGAPGFNPFDFVIPTDIGTDTSSTRALVIGDVNGDLAPDIVEGNANSENNLLYLNNNAGPGMDPFAAVAKIDFSMDSDETLAVALADLNGDQMLDLIAGNFGTGSGDENRIYLNTGMPVPFGPGIDLTSDTDETTSLAAADLNGDGRVDIVVGNMNAPNRLYLNNRKSTTATITIDINNLNDAPNAVAQNFRIDENTGNMMPVGTVAATDDEMNNLGFVFNPQNATEMLADNAFQIHPTSGQITVKDTALLDFETNPQFTVTVDITDDGMPAPETTSIIVTVDLDNKNDPPAITASQMFNIDENTGNGTSLGFVAFTDDDLANMPADTHMFAFTSGDTGAFEIDPMTGELTVKDVAQLDAEGPMPVHMPTVTITDSGTGNLMDSASVTITIDNVNDPPIVPGGQSFTIAETAGMNATVGTVTAMQFEGGEIYIFAIVGSSPFAIHPLSGAITLTNPPAINYEPLSPNFFFDLSVKVTDDGQPNAIATTTVRVNISNVNEAPDLDSGQSFMIPENLENEMMVGTLTFTELDLSDTLVFSIDTPAFSIDEAGVITVADTTLVDFEMTPVFNAMVTVTDQNGSGLSDTEAVTISLTDVNDPPSITLPSSMSILEDSVSTVFGVTVSDDENETDPILIDLGVAHGSIALASTANLTLIDNDGSDGSLQFSGSQMDITTALAAGIGYTPEEHYHGPEQLTVTADDQDDLAPGGRAGTTVQLDITILSVNDKPSLTAANPPAILEDTLALQTVPGWAAFSPGPVDESGQSLVAYIIDGISNPALFSQLPSVDLNGNLTYQVKPDVHGSSAFTIRAQDDGTNANGGTDTSDPDQYAIVVTPINDKPSFTAADPPTVLENSGSHSIPMWITAFDTGNAFESTQSIINGIVSNVSDPSFFTAGPEVSAAGELTYTLSGDASGSVNFDVAVQDSGDTSNSGIDISDSQTFTLTVTDINDRPTFSVNPTSIPAVLEDSGEATLANWATFDAGSPYESGQSLQSYDVSVTGGAALFQTVPSIDGTGTLTYTPAADANGSATISVTVTDDGGTDNGGIETSLAQEFTIVVAAVNDAPTFTASNPADVDEDSGPITQAGWIAAFSPGPANESGQTVATSGYTVSIQTNPGLFSSPPAVSDTGDLTFTPAAGASGSATFSVTVRDNGGTDDSGVDTSNSQSFAITVNEVNDKPSFAASDPPAILEDAGPQGVDNWAIFAPGQESESGQAVLDYMISSVDGSFFTTQPDVDNTGRLTYTVADDVNGMTTFDVRVQDNGGTDNNGIDTSDPVTITITVTPVNDRPSFIAANPPAINEDAGMQIINGWVSKFDSGPNDEFAQTPTYLVENVSDESIFDSLPSINAAGDLSYAVADDLHGMATFDVKVMDNGGKDNQGEDSSVAQTFIVTVNSVNDQPTVQLATLAEFDEDAGPQLIAAFAEFSPGTDQEDGQTLDSFIVSDLTNPGLFLHAPAVDNSGQLTFTAAADAHGTATFNVAARDTGGELNGGTDTSAKAPATIVINPVNDAPVIILPQTSPTGLEDNPLTISGIAITDADAGSAPLLVDISIRHGSLTLLQTSGLTLHDSDGSDGTLQVQGSQTTLTAALAGGVVFAPAQDFHGNLLLRVTGNDLGSSGSGGPKSASSTLMVQITSANDPPTVQPVAFTLAENAPNQTVVGVVNASDPEAQPFHGAGLAQISNQTHDTRQLAVIDLNGDTFPDVVAANAAEPNSIYLAAGAVDPFNGVAGKTFAGSSTDSRTVALGDVNGDNHPDVIFGNAGSENQLHLNNGTADPFDNVFPTPIGAETDDTRALALADFNGDGHPDLVAVNAGSQPTRIYLNNGTTDPFQGVTGTKITADANDSLSVAYGDLDGDSDLDLVVGNASGQRNRVYLNNGTATPFFGIAGIDLTSDAHDTRDLVIHDVNADNALDVVAANSNQPDRLYLNNGTTTPFNAVTGSDISPQANDSRSVAIADVNGDLDPDLVIGIYGAPNQLHLNNGTDAPFSDQAFDVNPGANNTVSVVLTDLNADNRPDLLEGNAIGGEISSDAFLLNSGQSDTLTYAILSGNTRNAFTIDPATGEISVANSTAVDFEVTPEFNLQIIAIDDGPGNLSGAATVAIELSNANEPPAITAPATLAATEDTPQNVLGVSISDPDAGSSPISATISAVNGSIALVDNSGLTLTDADGSDGSIAFNGSQTAINSALASGISYHPPANFTGLTSIDIATDDQGQSGSLGQSTDSHAITVTVAPHNDAPTTSGIMAVLVVENSFNSTIDLFTAFADTEDADSELTLTVGNNTNPGLFDSVSINPSTGVLTLDYATDSPGISLVTVQAEDTGNAKVETTFQVIVQDIHQGKSVASDPGQTDWLGYSVAIDGDFMVGGAWRDDDLGTDSGSVFVFQRRPGNDDAWDQIAKLNAPDGQSGDAFGRSVAIAGDLIVVGADGNIGVRGAAYLFQRSPSDPSDWTMIAKVSAADGASGAQFGWSVSLSADTLVVGAPGDKVSGRLSAGSSYIFERNHPSANQWGQSRKLIALDGAAGDRFGSSVSVHGDTVLVGAPTDHVNSVDTGSAYLFGRNEAGAGQWGQITKLTAGDGASGDWFGWSVAVSQNFAVIGAYRNDSAAVDSGSAYVFDRNQGGSGAWGQRSKLVAVNGQAGDSFGYSVALDGDNIVVGAYRNDSAGSSTGLAYLFHRSQGGPDNFGQLSQLQAADPGANAQFGFAVAVDRSSLAIGAPGATTAATEAGAVYTFRLGGPIEDFRMAHFTIEDLADPTKEATLWGDNADPDGDGDSNFFEFVAGLDPHDGGSNFTFTIELVPDQPTHRKITYGPIVDGRTYVVQFTDGLGSSEFTPLAGGIIEDQGNMRIHTDTNAGGFRVYRVQVSIP